MLLLNIDHCLTAVSSAFGGRQTYCSANVVRAADDRQTIAITQICKYERPVIILSSGPNPV
ncbi:MAG: hypothetical protein HXL33_02925 [Prevotellaceae bacterium]|nr:hypothetical protein [Prevotellaceae bacterium]